MNKTKKLEKMNKKIDELMKKYNELPEKTVKKIIESYLETFDDPNTKKLEKNKIKNITFGLGKPYLYPSSENVLTFSIGDEKTRWSYDFFLLEYENGNLLLDVPNGGWNKNITLEDQINGIENELKIVKFINNNKNLLDEYIKTSFETKEKLDNMIKKAKELQSEIEEEKISKNNTTFTAEDINTLFEYFKYNDEDIYIPVSYLKYNNGIFAKRDNPILFQSITSKDRKHLGWEIDGREYKNKAKNNLIEELKNLYLNKQDKIDLINNIEKTIEEKKKMIEEYEQKGINLN